MLITLSFVWHMFAILVLLFIQMKTIKFVYYLLKKALPQLDEHLMADNSSLNDRTYTFHKLVNEGENFTENGALGSLKPSINN
jgi:hypothetical protein